MKRFLKGATASFLMYFVSFIIVMSIQLDKLENWLGFIPVLFLVTYTTCLITDGIIKLLEWKYYSKNFEWITLVIAGIISLPFLASLSIIIPIYIGALGFYIGRKAPDHWTVYIATPIPFVLALIGLTFANISN